jgi:hypothetical protein
MQRKLVDAHPREIPPRENLGNTASALGRLCLKLDDRLVHFVPRARVDTSSTMKDAVHGCFAAAAQVRNFIN